jgi:putative tryptophan/tyrosine transport system substrate-binding protein
MRRREFFRLTAGLLVWPLPALAQEKTTAPTIGFLHGGTLSSYATDAAAFRDGLNQSGYVEGENLTIEYRWADNQLGRLPELAADLVRRQVSVIFAGGGPSPSLAAKGATSTIPIVFANGVDPVKAGLVGSLNRPGGNVTGITFLNITLGSKRLEVLRELVPNVRVVAALINPKIRLLSRSRKTLKRRPVLSGCKPTCFMRARNRISMVCPLS